MTTDTGASRQVLQCDDLDMHHERDASPDRTVDVSMRPARVDDLPFIFRGEKQYMLEVEPAHLSAWSDRLDKNLQLWIENLDRTIVCVVDGDDGGYAMWHADGPDVTLITIHVLHRLRGRGVGARLLAAVIEHAHTHHAQRLHLNVAVHNPARRLYERMGFQLLEAAGDYAAYELELLPDTVDLGRVSDAGAET